MKRARLELKPKQSQKIKYIYAASAAFILFVFVVAFLYMNTGVSYKAKAVADTQFSSAELSYSRITDGTRLTKNTDHSEEEVFTDKSIGFSFNYNGAPYTTVSIATNGFIAMGGSVASSSSPISGGSTDQVISAFGANLQGQSGSSLRYKTTGSAPNRIFVVQWENYRRKNGSDDSFNFQIKLHETSNMIQIVYGDFEIGRNTDLSVQVGLRGASSNSYSNRTNVSGSTTNSWSETVAGTNKNSINRIYSLGFSFFGYWVSLGDERPSNGLTYTFSPQSLGNTWLGYTDNWNTASNWSSGVPGSSTDAIIPASPIGGNFPIINSGTPEVKNLSINVGAILTISGGEKLTVKGNFLNEGSSSTGAGEVEVDNNILQWVKGKVGNFIVNKTGNVTLDNDIEITGALKLNKGSLILNGKKLTINGSVESSNGTISGSSSSDMIITGTGDLGTLKFAAGARELRNLTINRSSAGTVTLGSDLTVSNQLTLTNGTIVTGTNNLIVTNTSTSAISGHNENSYIVGNLRRYINPTGSYDLPVGSSDKGYQFANINFNSSTGISYIDATFTTGETTLPNIMIGYNHVSDMLDNGYWTISPDVEGAANYDLTIVSRGHSNGEEETGQHTLIKRHDASSPWEALGEHNNDWNSGEGTALITLIRKGLTSFSDVGGGISANGSLPVEFVNFEGKFEDKAVKLNWTTASETNNDHFEVERSTDGIEFTSIGNVAGSGNSDSRKDYEFTDSKIHNNKYYYRIKQVDFNGKFAFSNIISVEAQGLVVKTEEALSVEIYPNPTTFDNINLKITSADKVSDLSVLLFSTDGQLVHKEEFKMSDLNEAVRLNLTSPLQPKMYLIRVQQQNNSTIKQVIITD
ncbi:MAG TPA: T9SS type A sorting domain-containing protein [Cytophagales bacterium]|nr:T9SS type A sorting domain-containing protein [Cytophagales bacterium]